MKRYLIRRVKIGMSTDWPWVIYDRERERHGWAKSLSAAITLTSGESVQFVYTKSEQPSAPDLLELTGYWGPRVNEDSLAA